MLACVTGCAGGRFMPAPPTAMMPPPSVCAVRPLQQAKLPAAARGSGRVALIKPRGPDEPATAAWSQLRDYLGSVGFEVAPYDANELDPVECDDRGHCDLSPLAPVVGDMRNFPWVVIATVAEPPDTSTFTAISVTDGAGTVRRSLQFVASDGDLVGALAAPREIATSMAEHDDPRPPPDETELALASCIADNNEAPNCPTPVIPLNDSALELVSPERGVARVIWRDAEVEVALPMRTMVQLLGAASEDDWDERRGEWAADRLRHIRALAAKGQTPWLSSVLKNNARDERMDAMVAAALADGQAEIHRCAGPVVPYLLRDPIATDDGDVVVFRLPDGAFLFPVEL